MLKSIIRKNISSPKFDVYISSPKQLSFYSNNLLHSDYDLNYTSNVCHVDYWKLSSDFSNICKTNDLEKIKIFHDSFVVNYNDFLKQRSLEKYSLSFYDSAWKQQYEIDFDVYHRFMNYNYMKYNYDTKNNDKYVLEWFNSTYKIDTLNHYRVFRHAILSNKLDFAKKLHEIRQIDLKKEFRWKSDIKEPIFTKDEIQNLKNKEIKNFILNLT
jgi:hypothetical protein